MASRKPTDPEITICATKNMILELAKQRMIEPMIPQAMLNFATDNSRVRFAVSSVEDGSKCWSRKRIATLSVASRERM